MELLRSTRAELVILPGVSLNTPSPQHIQNVIHPAVTVFVEHAGEKGRAQPFFLRHDTLVRLPRQLFPRSPKAKELETLESIWPSRKCNIGPREVAVLMCGELNGFDVRGMPKYGRQLPYDILVNPTHSIMGRWNHLDKKFKALSRKKKVVIHTANNDRNHPNLSTDVRIYVDGVRSCNKTMSGPTIAVCECDV